MRLGLTEPKPKTFMNTPDNEVCEMARTLKRCKEAVAMIFGERYAQDPLVVAEFLKADALGLLAIQVKTLRETLSDGTGAITINIERPT